MNLFYYKVLQDIFHLFERSDNVVLDGQQLDKVLKECNITLTPSEIDSTLTILTNHGSYAAT